GLQRNEPAQRQEWDISYALRRKVIDYVIIVPVCEVVEVLHADYLCSLLSLSQLLGRDIAHTEMTDQSLTFELSKHGQRFRDRPLRWPHPSSNPNIHELH